MSNRRSHGTGGLDQRGENSWRLRYRVDGKVHTKSFRGTKTEAGKELRRLLLSGDTGTRRAGQDHARPVDRGVVGGRRSRSAARKAAE